MKIFLPLVLILILINHTNSNSKDVGLFDKLFGKTENRDESPKIKSDTTQLVSTAEMLDEDIFWKIIDKSLKSTKNQDDQEQFLISEIIKLSPKEIIGFRLRTDYLLYQTYTSEMWCAGYIMNGGCSDDSFEYFRCWIISKGKDTYYKTKENPDYLINEVVEGAEFYDFESFWYVALDAFKHKTGKELYDYIDNDNFKTKEGAYPQFEFTWQEGNPESMKKICPKLFDKFND
jgi:hypothetical protein